MIDLKSGQSHLVWRKDWERNKELTLAASSMCFESQDSSFYAFSFKDGGTLWKIPMKDSEWRVMARPVKNNIIHQDYDLNLYSSPLYNKLFVVMDKVLADQTHHFFIYSIDTPLMQEDEIRQQVKQKEWSAMPICLIGGGCLLLCFALPIIYIGSVGNEKRILNCNIPDRLKIQKSYCKRKLILKKKNIF